MYLKSLEISGFKSFAKKSNLDFKSAVTAIVGPNGSGKSNVAEAFRFVLGEQSLKSMRGKRGEDMIWSGSNEQPRANRAFVKAIFDNSKRVFNIDFDEVSIERAVNRDGTNEYSINGTQVRLKDVLELLAGAHVGSSGHHIISQGEADRILTSNIKERKEMIEDALGLKIYQYKRQESDKKLEKTRENIKQVESLRREIAPHIKFLKKQMEKVSRAEEVREKLTGLYKEYLKREKVYVENNKKNISEEKEPLLVNKKKLEEDMLQARKNLEASSEKDGKSEQLLTIEEDIDGVRRKRESYERDMGKIEGEISANSKIINNERIKSQNLESQISLKELEKLAEEIFAESSADSIKQKVREFIEKNKNNSRSSIIQELENKNKELEDKKRELEQKIKLEEENFVSLNKSYIDIKRTIEAEKDSSRLAEREIFRISGEEMKIDSDLAILRGKEDRLKFDEENLEREMKEAVALLGGSLLGFQNLEIQQEERYDQEERHRELEKMKIRLEELGTAGGAEVVNEFKEVSERDTFLERELADLSSSSESLKILIAELEEKLNLEFKEGITKINKEFHNFFSLMFGGGEAELKVVESRKSTKSKEYEGEEINEEESEAGIDINVSLPKKRTKGLQMLSGGERALTSIALLFAISQVNPPPFIILDETDAALDEANSKKYGDMIESLSKYSQLILITHNRETMSRAGVIYGVTMGSNGSSRLLSIAFDEAVSVAK